MAAEMSSTTGGSPDTLLDSLSRLEMSAEVPDDAQKTTGQISSRRITNGRLRWRPPARRIGRSVMECCEPPLVARGSKTAKTLTHYYCPMVPGGGGDWMQPGGELANPYWGDEMLRCGEVVRDMAARSKVVGGAR